MKPTRATAVALATLAAAVLHPGRAAAQADTTTVDTAAVTVTVGKTAETPSRDVPVSAVPRSRRSLNAISYEEVRNARVSNAYEVVHHLRPSWLRTPRGATSFQNHIDVAVFINGVRMGTRDALTAIPINSVRTLRFYTATEARQKFGGETSAGAIEVLSQ
jgi:hypothetical protein